MPLAVRRLLFQVLERFPGASLTKTPNRSLEPGFNARTLSQGAHGQMKSVLTDKEGRFFLDRVPPGLNTVHAYKEEDNYPDTFFALYVTNPAAVPRVMVIEGKEAHVDVKLGPKAIRVAVDVSDSDSGEQIQDASVELRQSADPSIYLSLSCRSESDGRCYVLIPAQPTRVKMIREGYEDRDITDEISADLSGTNLKPSETRNFSIHLRRAKRAVPWAPNQKLARSG